MSSRLDILINWLLHYEKTSISSITEKLDLNIGNCVRVWSRSTNQWKIGTVIKKHSMNRITVKYYHNSSIYHKKMYLNDEQLQLVNNLSTRIVVICTRNEGKAEQLLKSIKSRCLFNRIIRWRSSLSDYIQNQVNNAQINFIIIGAGGWKSNWLVNRVDVIFKYEWKVKAQVYNEFKHMLKPEGKLIKIPRWVCKQWVTTKFINDFCYNYQYFIEIRLRCLYSKFIPDSIKRLIGAYCNTQLTEEISMNH